MVYRFSKRSLDNLKGVHPDLSACVVACLYRYTVVDFVVIEGVRTPERQVQLIQQGKSWVEDSRHLIQPDGFGHAVDLAPWVNGAIPWDVWSYFEDINKSMQMAARYLQINVGWGGDWTVKDGPHFQLE